jgi:hypothetical protein
MWAFAAMRALRPMRAHTREKLEHILKKLP